MRGPHNIWRLIRTGATFERTGAMQVILDKLDLPPLLKLTIRITGKPFKLLGLKGDSQFPPIVRALTALGPAYIKFGQILSTRPDVVGSELAMQLSVLQESLPPFSRDLALLEIERDLEISTNEVFEDISEPIAAASIAQVHKAVLKSTGQTVAIKVLRPGIEKAFRKDIDAFYLAANIIEFLSPKSRRLRPLEVIKHFDLVVQGELDLRLEASAASEFSANTKSDALLCIPNIHWETSGRRVMTLDWVDGIPLADLEALKNSKTDMEELSTRILSMFLRHALRDGFFHGDMHQGNLKLNSKGELVIFDFGITTFPIFSVASAHAHDFVQSNERVELSAALMFYYALGAIVTPLLALFMMIASGHVLQIIFGLSRMRVRPPRTERTPYIYAPRASFFIGRLLERMRDKL